MRAGSFILSHGFLEAGEEKGGWAIYCIILLIALRHKISKNILAPWLVQHFRLE